MNPLLAHPVALALTAQVHFAAENTLEIMGLKLRPDSTKAYLEIYLAHSFPVRTIDGTTMHPQVIANSYRSMLHQVFDLNHQVKAYNPEDFPRDRIVGAIVAVEFPPTPMGGWTAGNLKNPPSIRAAATVFKSAEGVARILGEHQSGRRTWTVSMENEYYLENSGFLVENADGSMEGDETPDEFAALGLAYYPALTAPESLVAVYSMSESRVTKKWKGRAVTALLGGLGGSVHFKGVGITPEGKEKEAEIATVLASRVASGEGAVASEIFAPLEVMLQALGFKP